MGALLSSPSSKNQSWEHGGASEPDSSKKPRMSAPLSGCGPPRLIPGLPDEISLQILARMPRMGYMNAKMVSRSWKAAVTGAEVYRVRKELGVSEEWLYMLTKSDDGRLVWSAFDPVCNQWQRLPLMPGVSHGGGGCRRGIPGVWFGDLLSAGVRISDVVRGWLGQKDCSLDRIPFCGSTIGMVDGCIYVLGGFSRASAMKCVWRYDPFVNAWQEVSSMSTGRAFCKASLLNNKLYVVGGVSKGKNGLAPLQSAEVFDPRTGIWAEMPDMPFSKAQALPTAFLAELLKPIATGVTSFGGKLYVPQSLYSWPFFVDVGGETFDPETNSWAEMPVGMGEGWPARQAGTKLSAVIDGDLYALEPSTSSDRGKIKIYDPQEDTWKVAVGQVPVGDFAESECPYLLAGFLGKLHLIIKDVNSKINIMQTDVLKPVELSAPGTVSTCQDQHLSSQQETNLWKVIASKDLAAAELVSCQVLNI
ncbi:F-box/kelch-repeat protein At1g22040-like [Oryza brachyantha]|uniref:F-box domain-containing protein n=1 Tax=Oryza brachyantha TaxID=4533 RepID=J3N224_ORYBR|nr:F-box/kelch-repeat protein At1g22040-like [Oryza brachyantha]